MSDSLSSGFKFPDGLSLGVLMRSVFAGCFFVISFTVNHQGYAQLVPNDSKALLSQVVPISLFVGLLVYGIHRSIVYPIMEACFDDEICVSWRKDGKTLISVNTISNLIQRWDRAAGPSIEMRQSERARRISSWADIAHSQYVASECIILGLFAAKYFDSKNASYTDPFVLPMAFLMFLAGVISDWRLRAFQDELTKREKREEQLKNFPSTPYEWVPPA